MSKYRPVTSIFIYFNTELILKKQTRVTANKSIGNAGSNTIAQMLSLNQSQSSIVDPLEHVFIKVENKGEQIFPSLSGVTEQLGALSNLAT